MSAGIKTRYATSAGHSIAYQVAGGSGPPLIQLSSGTISFESIDEEPAAARFWRRLASFSQLISYDRRGMGLSDRGAGVTPTSQDWVDDAIAVLDEIGVDDADVLCAYGSSIEGVLLAATFPERVRKLIIINGFVCPAEPELSPPLEGRPPEQWWDDGSQFDPDATEHGVDVLSMLGPSVADDAAFRSWWDRSGNRGASPAIARAQFDTMMRGDSRPLLGQVTAPTLVIERLEARSPLVSQGRYLAEHIAGASHLPLHGEDALWWVGDTTAMLDAIEEFVTGARISTGERVLATVLFTDIVGSTDQAAALGDQRWRDLLDLHDVAVRTQIERMGGREVNTTGDGFVATFDAPGRAIDCALGIFDALESSELSVRQGIHTGEIEVRGDDIAGMSVHVGARIAALADPDQVLVSSVVKDLLVGSHFNFAPLGEHELKGVPGAWTIYAVGD